MTAAVYHEPWPEFALAACDMDGTLLDLHSTITKRTARAVIGARQAGVEVLVATGRSHRTAEPLLAATGMRWAICSNGATLYDLANHRVVSQRLIDASIADAIVELGIEMPGLGFAWETPEGLFRDDTLKAILLSRYGNDSWASSGQPPLHEVTHRLIKVLVGHPTLGLAELAEILRARFAFGLEVSSSGAAFIELTAPGADKGVALAELCSTLGVDQAHTAAFGDQYNDLGMLQWVARGYAMANADPAVLAITPHRAPHHAENGVAQVLEALTRS